MVVRRRLEAGGRGKERVNLSVLGHHSDMRLNLAPSRRGAGGFTGYAAIPPTRKLIL